MSQKAWVYILSGVFLLGAAFLLGRGFWSASDSDGKEKKLSSRSKADGERSEAQSKEKSSRIFGPSIWQDERLGQEIQRGRFQRPLAEQLKIEGEVNRLADLYEARDEFTLEKELLKLIESSPDVPEYRAMLGYLYYQWDDYDKAQLHWEEMIKMDPENDVVRARLAEAQAVLGDTASSIQNLQTILERNPGSETALMGMMGVLEMDGDAYEFLERHYRANPNNSGAATVFALQKAQRGEIEEAEQMWNQVVDNDPEAFSAQHHLAALNLSRGDFPKAEQMALGAYRSAKSRADQDVAASLYSEILLLQNRVDSYVGFLEERLQENPGDLVLEAQKIRAEQLLQ
jgi:tetratricopeptide (TPR) repeat protein